MNVLRSVLKRPSSQPLVAPARRLWAKANDVALNIDTRIDLPLCHATGSLLKRDLVTRDMPLYRDAVDYESPDYWYVRRIGHMLFGRGRDLKNEVFFDLGSGKGRILCVMAMWPIKTVVGVELSENLCDCAKENATRMRGRRAPIQVICQDAAIADLATGTTYFMFNPFGADTLRAVCRNIRRSVTVRRRRIRVVYYNSVHEKVLASDGWLKRYHDFETQTGLRITFWSNS